MFVMAAAVLRHLLDARLSMVINNHLPAAVCAAAAMYAAVRIWFDGERRLRYFVVAGLFAGLAAANELPALALLGGALALVLLWKAPRPTLLGFTPAVLLVAAAFFGTNWIAHRSLEAGLSAPRRGPTTGTTTPTSATAGRSQSYWNNPAGIDRGEPSAASTP